MEFDIEKWNTSLNGDGILELEEKAKLHPVLKKLSIRKICLHENFDPLDNIIDYGIFAALGYNLKDYVLKETITGTEALQALIDGKVLVSDEDGYGYIIKDGVLYVDGWWISDRTFNNVMKMHFTLKEEV